MTKKKSSIILLIVGALVFLCGICCTSGMIIGSTPEAKATATARALERLTKNVKLDESVANTPKPANTQSPTNTPRPTNTPKPANTQSPTNTPRPMVFTDTPQPLSTPLPPSATPVPALDAGEIVEIHFIDVGQGDAILIRGAGATVLIDGGEQRNEVINYLSRVDVQRLDAVIATHPHSDHIGGLIAVIQSIPVDVVITSGQPHTTLTYEHFLDAILASQAEYREVKRGDQIQAGGLTFHVLHPVSPDGDDLNEQSIVLHLDHHEVSALFTGDIESASESSLVASGYQLKAQILKVPHHASRSSNTRAFLQSVQPEFAIYCAGTGNNYDHPHTEALVALEAVGATIYGTDVNGTVVVTMDGHSYQVSATRGLPVRVVPAATATPEPPAATATPRPPAATAMPKPPAATATQQPAEPPAGQNCPYIGNRNTMKFHVAGCRHINQMSEENKVCLQSREDAIAQGYTPCGTCKP